MKNKIATKKEVKRFLKSNQWKALRYKMIKNNKSCSLCGSSNDLDCDHKLPLRFHWDLRLEPSNIEVTCKLCADGKRLVNKMHPVDINRFYDIL